MANIAGLVFPFFGLILLGYISGRNFQQPKNAMGWLNIFIIYIALPALFFKLLSKTPVEDLISWKFIVTNIFATFSVFLLVFAISCFLRKATIAESTIQGLSGAYGNIGYMGPGIAILTFGEMAAVPVALIFCFENIMHFSITPTMMAISGKEQKKVFRLVIFILKSISFHPFIIATALGIGAAIIGFQAPTPIQRLVDLLAQAAAPSALFAMGVALALRPLNKIPIELAYIVPIKLVLHPIIMYLFLSWAGNFDPLWVSSAVLLAALPTATNVFIFAQQYGFWIERSSASILISTLLSVITISVLLYFITTGPIPHNIFSS